MLALVDILWTTLRVDHGAGPLSSALTTALWRALRRVGGSRSRALRLAGPLMLVATLGVWVAAIWAGWTLVFAAGDAALVYAGNSGGVSWTGRIYFVADAMFTMGNGDVYPGSGGWQLATALTTASGMLFVTMGVSYVLSVVGCVSEKRAFASTVTGLGEPNETIVTRGYNGGDFDDLHVPLSSLASDLDLLAEQHRSYPVLNYYHTEEPSQAAPNGVAVLDDAWDVTYSSTVRTTRPSEQRAALSSRGGTGRRRQCGARQSPSGGRTTSA
ncbi:potassium channel family protein [Halobacterium bonnevillei]|uniref:Two pore domain potassium channel family protein n=1 Tax=Halobacterium bonnevillei TaxID=2692200 RepID=A0A6B0SGB8_9EURY|nr:potassium channel family protein [Halobacterium bonnevillei]MXR20804.1 two pore domain potassium channel family protein [Halobacterium bonnevillei]